MKIIENRNKFFGASLAILLLGLAFILFNQFTGKEAFNYDVEFSGGLSYNIDIGQNFDNDDISKIFTEITGQPSPQVQKILGTNQVSVKIKSIEKEQRDALVKAITEKYGIEDDNFTVNDVSATVSNEMRNDALKAVGISCIAMLIYISVRFRDVKTGASAIIALIHDALFVLIVYGVLRIPLNNSFIAAILTILGYSINATIIIFDRIRENKRMGQRADIGELINKSVNQTLSRCINTTLTTLITITILYFMGVSAVKEFALPIIIGVLCGTYTSVCFSGSIYYVLTIKKENRI